MPTSRHISSLTKLYGYDIGDKIEILSYCHDGYGGWEKYCNTNAHIEHIICLHSSSPDVLAIIKIL